MKRGVPIPPFVDIFVDHEAKLDCILPVDVGNEVDGKPVVMRALPRARFRSALNSELVLPVGLAERLEDLEKGLRLAGFMRSDEVICQRGEGCAAFRVKNIHVSDDHRSPRKQAIIDRREIYARLNAKTRPALPHSAVGPSLQRPPASLVAKRNRR